MDTPNLYIYWAHDAAMMSPTLQVARTYLKRRLPINKATLSTWILVLRILLMTAWALASLTVQTVCEGHFALRTEYAAMVLKGLHWGQRWSYTIIPQGQTVSRTRIFYAFRLWFQMGCSFVISKRDEIAPSSEPYHYSNPFYKPTKDQRKLPRVTAFMGVRHCKNESKKSDRRNEPL